jgi:hypothetical protein
MNGVVPMTKRPLPSWVKRFNVVLALRAHLVLDNTEVSNTSRAPVAERVPGNHSNYCSLESLNRSSGLFAWSVDAKLLSLGAEIFCPCDALLLEFRSWSLCLIDAQL